MTLQIESGGSLRRTVCATCDGTGETEGEALCACGCRGRACGFRIVRCPDCGGSGHDESAYEDCCPICNEFESECCCAEPEDHTADPCPCGDPECSRPWGHPEAA